MSDLEDELADHPHRMCLLAASQHLSIASVIIGTLLAIIVSGDATKIISFAVGCLIGFPKVSFAIVSLVSRLRRG